MKPTELFSYLIKKGKGDIKDKNTFILEDLKNVLNTIEQTSMGTASEDDFKGLFDDIDLTSTKLGSRENQKNDVVVEVLVLLSGIDFKLEDTKSDLLGDAYEYLIGEFAAGAGKKGGEFYTPAQVSRIMTQIVSQDKKRVRSVYDPTCGSGSLLLRVGDFTEVVSYYGQELNPTTYNLARMSMILHGVHFDIRQGDTLTEDMHADIKAEVIIANPPFATKWKSDSDPQLAHDVRLSSVVYDPTDEQSILFFKTVQNKVHYAITGNTVAEIVAGRVDSKKPNIGLTNFRGSKPTKEEVLIAKNYLNEQELLVLNNLVEQYLVFAEGQAMQRVPMYMKDWIDKLHGFLQINNKDILKDAGKISHELAVEIAEKNFDEYKKVEAEMIDNNFDKEVKKILEIKKKK